VFDHESGREVELPASRVLNFAGPWHRWALGDRADPLHPPSVAFNLLFRGRLPGGAALAVRARDGKNLFLWARDGCIHAGTRHLPWAGSVDRPRVESDRIDELIEDLRGALPGLRLGKPDLLAVQVGFLPARAPGESEMAHRDQFLDHGAHGGPDGLVSVSGVKYTTAPIVAERALHRIFRSPLPIRETARARPTPAADGTRPTQTVPTIAEIVRFLDESPETVEVVRRLIEEEMVSHLDELLLGRLDGISLGPGLRPFAQRLVSCLGWDRDRTAAELDRLESRLQPLLPPVVG
jgi:glycerol-3-phosphate dehydrogenase